MAEERLANVSPKFIRNVCVIAHVDHGKTTLTDHLLSYNGVISERLAGKLRFMDSREDEQVRGITMKSSVVSLFVDPMVINLIDSPGHVDFVSEVNSAINGADIALVLIDAVEGVCSQTEALLRQAVLNQLQLILVINKLDRLIVELKMTENEALRHLNQLLENVNSFLSQIIQIQTFDTNWESVEVMERRYHFNPSDGNVIFASAAYGFAFTVNEFARIWAPKLEIEEKVLASKMYDDYYLAGRKIAPNALRLGKRVLFEQLVLSPVWEVVKCGLVDADLEKLRILSAKLNIPLGNSKRIDEAFGIFMRSWIPLSSTLFRPIARCRSASDAFASPQRLSILYPANDSDEVRNAIANCDPNSTLCVLFVIKLFSMSVADSQRLSLIRILSGTLQKGGVFYAASINSNPLIVTIQKINFMLGRELLETKEAPAGSIVAVEMSDYLPSTTLFSSPIQTLGLKLNNLDTEPLVRVTVRPGNGGSDNISRLRDSLKQLSLLDCALNVFEQEDGDLAMVTAGEVHLQKCIQDLTDMGHEELEVSEPIVPLLETITPDPQSSFAKIVALQSTECTLKSFKMRLKLRAVPLSDAIISVLIQHEKELRTFRESRSEECEWLQTFRQKLLEAAQKSLPLWKGTFWQRQTENDVKTLFENVWTFGPIRAQCNILFNAIPGYDRPSVWDVSNQKKMRALDRAIVAGFDLCVANGPLCSEPMRGVGFVMESWELGDVDEDDQIILDRQRDPELQGQLISAAKQSFCVAVSKHPMRLVSPMYSCKITTNTGSLGKVHAVLSQRRAKVVNEDVNDVSGLFEIVAHMPIGESFSFCDQLRKRTSGAATAQLRFSHWQIIDEDPFWTPTTEEELEEFGVKGDSINLARLYMNAVRKRKGLQTDELIVVNAEKQRNLKRNR